MGAMFYIIGFLLVAVLFGIAIGINVNKNKDKIVNYMIDQICYSSAKNRGYIRPGKDENDRRALDFAIKHNKKVTWKVIDLGETT